MGGMAFFPAANNPGDSGFSTISLGKPENPNNLILFKRD
jgi:hypothetical protein